MKTVQAVARYFPDNCGGIQTHLSQFLPALQTFGVESKIAASQDKPKEDNYEYKGVEVYRYPAFPEPMPEPNHGPVPHAGFEQFASWLKQQKADLYNQHQWIAQCGSPHLRLAKELGMATVVTLCLPRPVCLRNTFMLHGKEACDGKIDQIRCSYCSGVPKVLPTVAIDALSRMPASTLGEVRGKLLYNVKNAPKPIQKTVNALTYYLSTPSYVAARKQGLLEMARFADRIILVSQWMYDALLLNGLPPEKLVLCRHGISDSWPQQKPSNQPKTGALRVGFLGRWYFTKGVHVLIEAIKSLPTNIPIELFIHGIPQDEAYRQKNMARIGDDKRIHIEQQLTREELPSALTKYDVIAMPSQWFENCPLVVLESQASGLPVVGSNLGGIAELVHDGIDGLLVTHDDVQAWAEAFRQLATDANLLTKLRQGIEPVKTMSMEAQETAALYEEILAEQSK